LEQPFNGFEILQVPLVGEVQVGVVRREQETDILAQKRVRLPLRAAAAADRGDGNLLVLVDTTLFDSLQMLQISRNRSPSTVFQ
jgi:hypothetical protein